MAWLLLKGLTCGHRIQRFDPHRYSRRKGDVSLLMGDSVGSLHLKIHEDGSTGSYRVPLIMAFQAHDGRVENGVGLVDVPNSASSW